MGIIQRVKQSKVTVYCNAESIHIGIQASDLPIVTFRQFHGRNTHKVEFTYNKCLSYPPFSVPFSVTVLFFYPDLTRVSLAQYLLKH